MVLRQAASPVDAGVAGFKDSAREVEIGNALRREGDGVGGVSQQDFDSGRRVGRDDSAAVHPQGRRALAAGADVVKGEVCAQREVAEIQHDVGFGPGLVGNLQGHAQQFLLLVAQLIESESRWQHEESGRRRLAPHSQTGEHEKCEIAETGSLKQHSYLRIDVGVSTLTLGNIVKIAGVGGPLIRSAGGQRRGQGLGRWRGAGLRGAGLGENGPVVCLAQGSGLFPAKERALRCFRQPQRTVTMVLQGTVSSTNNP